MKKTEAVELMRQACRRERLSYSTEKSYCGAASNRLLLCYACVQSTVRHEPSYKGCLQRPGRKSKKAKLLYTTHARRVHRGVRIENTNNAIRLLGVDGGENAHGSWSVALRRAFYTRTQASHESSFRLKREHRWLGLPSLRQPAVLQSITPIHWEPDDKCAGQDKKKSPAVQERGITSTQAVLGDSVRNTLEIQAVCCYNQNAQQGIRGLRNSDKEHYLYAPVGAPFIAPVMGRMTSPLDRAQSNVVPFSPSFPIAAHAHPVSWPMGIPIDLEEAKEAQ